MTSEKGRPARKGQTRPSADEQKVVYRGIRLHLPAVATRYSDDQIEQAVQSAIKKHPDVFGKKE